jgi:oligosaccharyl transferase (archaeosortase A-associated)
MPFNIKNPSRLVIGILILVFFGIAIFVRTYYSYNAVFVGDWIKFTSNDAYYQMRLVDLIVHNFPNIPAFDPYLIYPSGSSIGIVHFFNWLLALVIWIFTLGGTSQHAIDIIGIYYPVILAALCIIPAYFIGKALFNRWAGLIAAGMTAVLPGEFLGRSILGGTDQHVAETLFSTVFAMFAIYALKSAWQNRISWNHVVKRNWKILFRPLLFSLLSGLFLGIYLITWEGAFLFVFIITVYFILQVIIDRFKGQSSFYLGFVGFFIFAPAIIIYARVPYPIQKMVLVAGLLIPAVLAGVSQLMSRLRLKSYYFPLALIVLAAVVLVVLKAAYPQYLTNIFAGFSAVFNPGGPTGATTIETQPFLSPNGEFTIAVAWGNFTTSLFLIPWAPIPGLAVIALIVLIVLYIKRSSDDKPVLFLFIWTIIIVIATLAQRRFAYYSVITMAILSGYLCYQAVWWFSKRRHHVDIPETLNEQYKRARTLGILGGIIAFTSSFLLLRFLTYHTMYFFVPVFVASLLSIFYGFWAWVKLKGLNDYMLLWAFIFPLGIMVLAFMESKGTPGKATAVKGKKKVQFNKLDAGKTTLKVTNKETLNPWLYRFNIVTLIVLVFITVFWPNWDNAKNVAIAATYAPSDAWEEAMYWLKDNTPLPMDSSKYYENFNTPPSGLYDYPESAYGVTTWWDYGYWITRTAQRLPSDNPSQEPAPIRKVANLLLSEDDQKAAEILKALNSRYVIIDSTMTTSKIWAVMVWANVDNNKYMQAYYYSQDGKTLIPVQFYTPEYYKLLSVRLYNFDGKASTSEKPWVVTYQNKTAANGNSFRLITNAQEFNSYQEAENYVNSHPDETNTICGNTPYNNPIPIEAVPGFNVVFKSTMNDANSVNAGQAEVKIFEYTGN